METLLNFNTTHLDKSTSTKMQVILKTKLTILANVKMRIVSLMMFIISVYSASLINKKIHFETFENCRDHKSYTIFITNIVLSEINGHQFVNYDMHVAKDVRGNVGMIIEITRCANGKHPETCEQFKSIKTNQLCTWTGMSPWYTPRLRCPLKRGVYRAKNCTFDGLTFIPVSGYFQFKVKVFDLKEKLVACFAGSYETIDL